MMRKLLPAPLLSLALLVMWLLLVRSYTLGQVLLGALAGWAMPWFFASLRPHRPRIRRPLVLALDTIYAIGMLIVLVA
ncbi:MAG: Na+/H+ antiporter subunit E, partial [Ottowia sp.]